MHLRCAYDPALNENFVLQRFERSKMVELRNAIMFDFYLGLLHIYRLSMFLQLKPYTLYTVTLTCNTA